jgi:hypothetical protein
MSSPLGRMLRRGGGWTVWLKEAGSTVIFFGEVPEITEG